MDNTIGFYPMNMGSIPVRRTRYAAMVKLVVHRRLKISRLVRPGSSPGGRTKYTENNFKKAVA